MKTAASRLAASMLGLSGDSIALILAVGLVLGTFPVYGCATVLCLLAAMVFRLNLPALQVVNQLSTPAQLALVVPFARLGERILGDRILGDRILGDQILGSPAAQSNSLLSRFSELTLQAVAGWLCISIPLGILLYIVLSYALRRRRPACFNELESAA